MKMDREILSNKITLDCLNVDTLNGILGLDFPVTSDFLRWFDAITDKKTHRVDPSAVLSLSFYLSTLKVISAFGGTDPADFVEGLVDEVVPEALKCLASDIAQHREPKLPGDDALMFYLVPLIKQVYSANSTVDPIVHFVKRLDFIEYDAIAYETLLSLVKNDSKLYEGFQWIELSYRVNLAMDMLNYPKLSEQYKNRFQSMKAELDAVVQERLEHWADQFVLRRDYKDIKACADRYEPAFSYHLSYLVEVAYDLHPSRPEEIIDFIHQMPLIRHCIIGFEALFQQMKMVDQLRHPCLIVLSYRCHQCKEMSNYPNIHSSYKERLDILTTNLDVALRDYCTSSWAKQIVFRGRKCVEAIQFASKNSNAFKFILIDLVAHCYQSNPKRVDGIISFVNQLPSINQRLLGYDALFKIMKERNKFDCLKTLSRLLNQMIRSNEYKAAMTRIHRDRLDCLTLEVDRMYRAKRKQKKLIGQKMLFTF